MSAPIKDGGPAFSRGQDVMGNVIDGMSLRDYFAGKAIEGRFMFGNTPDSIAGHAYALADEMLEAREKTP